MSGILDEVRDFLKGLELELPLLFKVPPKTRSSRRTIAYRGRSLELIVESDPASRKSRVHEHPEGLRLVRAPDDPAKPSELLRDWYAEKARAVYEERVAHFAPRMGVEVRRLVVRDQKTVWGSCSRKGDLSFNWRVLMAPEPVLDYLVVHELAHLREMNHSKRFWAHVAAQVQDWKVQRKWLADNARELKRALPRETRRRRQ